MKKKKSRVLPILVTVLTVLLLINGSILGYMWYKSNHIFVEKKAYPISAKSLDLREQDISFDHYNSLHSQLPTCNVLWNVPFQGGKIPSDAESIAISQLSGEDIELMQTYFPALKRVDALACDDYPMLEALQEAMPKLDVDYQVSLGSKAFAPDTEALTLQVGDYDLDTMTANLVYLRNAQSVLLKTPALTGEEINGLREAYPDIVFSCTVEILGQEYDAEVTELDLSALTSDKVTEVCNKLAMLTNLTDVNLMDSQGKSQLEKEEVKALIAAAPQAVFQYSFDFYGQTLSTATEEVIIKNTKIGDEGEAEIRFALDMLKNCKRFVLDNCKVSNDVMAQIRDDYRDQTKVVWRVYFGKGSSLTDAEVLRAVYDLVDDNSHDLVYCEDVRYLDIGHDEFLDYCDFISGMVNLEYAIISGSPIKDLSPFANCKKLKVLEIAFCEYLTDASPLAACENLEMLNISFTNITDLSPLDDLPLTHLMAMYPKARIPEEEQQRFDALHPDCVTKYVGKDTSVYGEGWRYIGKEKMDWYQDIANAFGYPNPYNHVGWYLKK